jgi:hypothetical protein
MHEYPDEGQPPDIAAELARDRNRAMVGIGAGIPAGILRPLKWMAEDLFAPVLDEDVRIRPEGDDAAISTHVVKSQRPIIFTDPTGLQFDFPLEDCEGWMV